MPVLGRKTCKSILAVFDDLREQNSDKPSVLSRIEPLYLAVSEALETKRSVKLARARKREKHEQHASETSEIRSAVWARSAGRCEHCGAALREDEGDLDHAPGFSGNGRRSQEQSLYTTWRLCRRCHHRRTEGIPSAGFWFMAFRTHLTRQRESVGGADGYVLAIVEVEKHLPEEVS